MKIVSSSAIYNSFRLVHYFFFLRYIPDFEIEGKLYEVKGQHLWKDGSLLHIYSKNDPYPYEVKEEILKAKSQCMRDNRVVVILTNELDKLDKLLGVI